MRYAFFGRSLFMNTQVKRVAINFGGGYVPGLNAVISGAVLAASGLGWEAVGIRDGFEGLLFPGCYPDGGLVKLTPSIVENLAGASGCILGTAGQSDPFHVRIVNAENQVEERDRSDELLKMIKKEKIDAVISVVGSRALSILWKLSRKGLKTVCVPKSVENDVAATALSFGFNSALSFVAEMLERARQAAQSARRIGVVEVLGEHAGWLALQAGMAVCADAVLIPEIHYDLHKVAAKLREKAKAGRTFGLVVVAEGARSLASLNVSSKTSDPKMKAALSPGATGNEGFHVIERSGQVAAEVALQIQRLTDQETYPLVLGQLVKGGRPTVVDLQLGLGYGAGAVRALKGDQSGVMVVFQPPDLRFVPMAEAINRVRTVPADSEFVQIARALGISLGD
jgi:ATP-dependent phosphofructokinase / diphosphate-dependent phosphofructokinase